MYRAALAFFVIFASVSLHAEPRNVEHFFRASAEPFEILPTPNDGLYSREGDKLFFQIGGFRHEFGVAQDPFDFEMMGEALITREGTGMHKYFRGEWKQIGGALDPFEMESTPFGLVTREGKIIALFDGQNWNDGLGKVGAEPFSWAAGNQVLYTREGNEIHKVVQGSWSKVGGTLAEPFAMATLGNDLIAIKGNELTVYDGTVWTKAGDIQSREVALVSTPRSVLVQDGKKLIEYRNGLCNELAVFPEFVQPHIVEGRVYGLSKSGSLYTIERFAGVRLLHSFSDKAVAFTGRRTLFIKDGLDVYRVK